MRLTRYACAYQASGAPSARAAITTSSRRPTARTPYLPQAIANRGTPISMAGGLTRIARLITRVVARKSGA